MNVNAIRAGGRGRGRIVRYDPAMSRRKLPDRGLVAGAVAFAVALLGTATLASRSLRERDAAVREGLLVRTGHALETLLRGTSPDDAEPALRAFLEEHADVLEGVAIVGPGGLLASAGEDTEGAFEIAAALGREWRPAALGPGAGSAPGPGGGPGGGRGLAPGRGPGGRSGPAIHLRLRPTPAVGRDSVLAGFVLAGGVAGAAGLVGLALVAARGLDERRRREAAEAEGRRLATVARAGAGLAHRLRNPLAVVKGTAQMLEPRVPEPERERAARIVAASGRMETILSRLLDFARPPEPQPTTFDLAELARDVAARGGGATVRAEGGVPARADREHAETVLEELLANARAFDPSGTVEVAVRRDGAFAVVEVADRGSGLEVDAAAAFEPYVTSRPDGTGLGLAIVRSLAAANGGTATLAGRPGGGCVASLALPAGEA